MKNKRKFERGQSFMELALMFVTLMMIVAALVDFGRMLYTYMSLVDSAQEGLLFLSLDSDNLAGATARVRDSTTFPQDINTATVTAPMPVGGWLPSGATSLANLCAGDVVTVRVTYSFNFIMPFINLLFPTSSINLISSATGPILTPLC